MNEVHELESADELVDSELEWESADELESTDESMSLKSSDDGMDEDIVTTDDNAVNTDSGCSTTYETPNKKAKKNLVDINGIENDRSTRGRRKSKKVNKDSDEIVGDHWSPDERALLLASIKQHGMLNMSHLASIIETKTVRQIKDFIIRVSRSVSSEKRNNAKKRAARRMASLKISKQGGRVDPKTETATRRQKLKELFAQEMGEGPIEWWLQSMENTMAEENKQAKKMDMISNPRTLPEMIPRACLLISQYEDHPDPSICSGVNYKEAYECLYHVLSGVPPKALSPPTAMFIQRSIDRLRNSILDGMYSPEYCKSFGEQLSHIQMVSKETRLRPKHTYGAPSKKPGPAMVQGIGLPSPSRSFEGLMSTPSFNPMMVPDTLMWRKGFAPTVDKSATKQRRVIRKDIPFGLFCDTDIYEGVGPSKTTK